MLTMQFADVLACDGKWYTVDNGNIFQGQTPSGKRGKANILFYERVD